MTSARWNVGLDMQGRWWSGQPEKQLAVVEVSPDGVLTLRGRAQWSAVVPTVRVTPRDVSRAYLLDEPDPRWQGIGIEGVDGAAVSLWCSPTRSAQILHALEDAGFPTTAERRRAPVKRDRRFLIF